MSCFKERETREDFFFFFLSLYLLGLGSNFVLCSSFSLSNAEQLARNVNARAQLRRVFGRVVALFSDIYLLYIKERKKEKERNWMSMMCVWVRETAFGCRREKREKRSSFYKTQDEKGGDNRIFFQGGDAAI